MLSSRFTLSRVATGVLLLGACRSNLAPAAVAAPPGPTPASTVTAVAPWDTAAPERARLVQQVLQGIAGREGAAAESVFTNIQMPGLKRVPARQLLQIMNLGYSRSLGVSCAHCHVVGNWASDDKKPKQIARGMIRLANALPAQIRAIEGINANAVVNCTTCHRGAVVPALNLPVAR